MSIHRVTVDTGALPSAPALLSLVKAHLRVSHTRDDELIKAYMAQAIGFVERRANVSLNPAEYLVSVDELDLWKGYAWWAPARSSWVLPLNNVREFILLDAPGGVDLSADYTLWAPDFGGNGTDMLVAKAAGQALPPADAALTLKVGLTNPDELSPPVFAVLARITGALYENREADSALWDSAFNGELMSLWRPSA